MKRILLENLLAFLLIIIAFVITGYFYKKGRISFFSHPKNQLEDRNTSSEFDFTEKEYKLSYKERPIDSVVEISRFEDQEKWKGDGNFDYANFIEGSSSLSLNSQNHLVVRAAFSPEEKFDIDKIANFKIYVFLRTPLNNLEEANLVFQGDGNISFKYPLRDLSEGWNYLIIPRSNFSEFQNSSQKESISSIGQIRKGEGNIIQSVVLEVLSRPKTLSSLNFDYLGGEENDNYLDDWNTNDNRFLSLTRNGNSVNLLLVGFIGQVANLKKVTSAKDYTFSARFIPGSKGDFGFFLRGDYQNSHGYFLTLSGVGTDTYSISKRGIFVKEEEITINKGKINNFKIEANMPYWLKTVLKGANLTFYFSTNGRDFVELGNAVDRSYSSGGVGLAALGAFVTVDDISFSQ